MDPKLIRNRHSDDIIRIGDGLTRCSWPNEDDELYLAYHDNAWGVPEYDDQALFAKLILDGFQAGLSWIVILRKEEAFRTAFHNFDPHILATISDQELDAQMQNPGIVRNRSKIKSVKTNAQAYLKLHQEVGFANYWWQQVGNKPIDRQRKADEPYPTKSELSEAISKDLKKHGFKFVGPTIVYAFMEAVGLINNHVVTCHSHQKCRNQIKERA
ncbi:MAG: DNA-3-methyladenine glycosylase I [OCS116 cluster bacterium]|uniref:DNA-3-methyladenine glycosylase I n=1 Tax=OCS116 cluster bacterium TaxID=2030921 RepID=A0A2A4Z9I7_9PROT|nr:DNA-3-methyladenine glycosylase I [OCS116 cluster bacterium]